MITGEDVLCISSIDWDFLWQGHQEIMAALARQGNRVLYVENTGVRRPTFRDLPRIRHRLHNWWRGTNGFREEGPGLFVYSPVVLPFPYSTIARWINRWLLLRSLGRWMQAAGFRRPIIWTFLPTPLAHDLIRGLDPVLTVYYCIDDLRSSSRAARRIASSEEALFRQADLVFATSERLRARATAAEADNVHLFPFGVDYDTFERVRDGDDAVPDDMSHVPRPIAGYVGGLHRVVDQELLGAVADALPGVNFVLVGPAQSDITALRQRRNVHILGSRRHADVPRYIKGFDVGLVPYRLTEYTAHVYPAKLNEYLAMGVPVVGTGLPELRRFNAEHGDIVTLADGPAAFAAAIGRFLSNARADTARRCIQVARGNAWQTRIADMSKLVEDQLTIRRIAARTWQDRLRRVYWTARRRLVRAGVTAVLAYLVLFNTPLLWLVAAPLKVQHPPRPAEAIVVFAGGVGESGKAGGGYQERVKQAADLYFARLAPRMIFSSGFAFAFSETEVMRDLALALGVPASAIVLETRAANTHDNVIFAQAILDRYQSRSILLVSSPYHMRRALLTWRRAAPNLDVIASPVPRSQFYVHDRGATLEQIRAIVQEYAAIVAYWWKGWI